MELIEGLNEKVRITPNGLDFSAELNFEEWESMAPDLVKIAKTVGFLVGDWLNYGESRYGEKYQAAVEATGLSYDTVKQYCYVAKAIKMCDRSHAVDFSHHLVVAKVKDSDKQRQWLELAEKERLTVARLRKSLNLGRLATDEDMQVDTSDRGTVTYLALLNRIMRWWKKELEKAPVENWDIERRQHLKDDFEFIVRDIWEKL